MLPLAILGAGALSAAGNFFGAKSAAKAQEEATRLTNENNYRMFQESRGSTGSAVLPEYLKPYEASLGTEAARTADAVFKWGGGATGRLADADRVLKFYNPALDAGGGLVIDLATGKVAGDRTAALAPVLGARTAAAKTRSAAILEGLNDTMARLRTAKTNAGFRGLSTFDLNRSQAATIGARTQAAQALADAEFQNRLAEQTMFDSNLQMRLGALDLPYQMATQRINLQNLPASALAQFYGNAMAPLSFFRLPTANPPQETPNPSARTTQFAGAAVGALGNTLGQYFAQQQMMEQLRQMYQQPQPASYDPTYDPSNPWG